MATESNVLVERDGSLGKITLNRPDARNPLDDATAREILAALDQHFADPAIHSVVITGAGEAFCAGGDLRQMQTFSELSSVQAFNWPDAIVAAHKRMLSADKPVIAAVNGAASAGGMGLAGMCDVIVAVESARFALPEIRVGLFPMIIVAQLARSLPRKVLLEMMLTGEPLEARDAHRLGFVNRLVPDRTALWSAVQEYARRFDAVCPTAVALGRRAFTLLADLPASQALDAAQFMNLPFFLGDDLKEGASAFLERRAPRWTPYPGPRK